MANAFCGDFFKVLQIKFLIYTSNIPLMPQLLQVSHVSKRNSSLAITIPKEVLAKLGVKAKDLNGFYGEGGKVILKKI